MKGGAALLAAGMAALLWQGALAFGASAQAGSSPEAPLPWQTIRTFLRAHDQLATKGENAGEGALAEVRREQAKVFEGAGPAAWDDPRTRHAAVVYVLAGGDAEILRHAMASKAVKPEEMRLLKGVLAYGRGQTGHALELLGEHDAMTLPPLLGGHLALAQALLIAPQDPGAALGYLNKAKLLLPGSLIEEAALRHTITLSAKVGDRQAFWLAARRYFHHFARSGYAPSFRRLLVATIVQWPHGNTLELLDEVTGAVSARNELGAGQMLVSVAEEALYAGKIALTRQAASRAVGHFGEGSEARRRAILYLNTALIFTEHHEEAAAELKALSVVDLRVQDGLLRKTALDLAEKLRMPPPPAVAVPAGGAQSEKGGERTFPSGTIRRTAANLIAEVDTMLAKAK